MQYGRIEDGIALTVNNPSTEKVSKNVSYSIATYNIGFGAYTHDFSFFMDSGEMLTGGKVSGKLSTAKDKQTVLKNTNGAIGEVKKLSTDFIFFQEVDTNADRSHKINQLSMLQNSFSTFSSVFAENFHSAYLLYPFNDPHGKTNAGVATFSSKTMDKSIRRSYPIGDSFPTSFFDLDRCFSVSYLPIEGSEKKLCLINSHMSAYDEGGKIREQQMALLNEVLKIEKDKGIL